MAKRLDLEGQRFGRLLVISEAGKHKNGNYTWNCLCDCGNSCVIAGSNLKSGGTVSCGCRRREGFIERTVTHGCTRERRRMAEYNIWNGIKERCLNPNNPSYVDYGARGITVCEEWKRSFETFLQDMGLRPSPKHSIDRINNDGPYSSENCRWSTQKEQTRNKRSNVYLSLNGVRKTLMEWSEITGIKFCTIHARKKAGWSDYETLTTPLGSNGKPSYLTLNNETKTLAEWSEITGINYVTLQARKEKGWSDHDVLTIPVRQRRKVS